MENLNFTAQIVHKQRQQDLIEEAKIERFLQEKKNQEVANWMQHRLRRNRKNK